MNEFYIETYKEKAPVSFDKSNVHIHDSVEMQTPRKTFKRIVLSCAENGTPKNLILKL